MSWYRRAADRGSLTGMCNLAWCCERGLGMETDYPQAIHGIPPGRRRGQPARDEQPGELYRKGKGVERDYDAALALYRRAAEREDDTALYNLGECYELGQGVEPDLEKALTYYRHAAKLGEGSALCALGRFYEKGVQVTADPAKALSLLPTGGRPGGRRGDVPPGPVLSGGEGGGDRPRPPPGSCAAAPWRARTWRTRGTPISGRRWRASWSG